MTLVTAILDKPSPRSFGMLAMIVRDMTSHLRTEGLAEPTNHELHEDDYRELLERGEATQLADAVPLPQTEGPHAALWLGAEFEDKAGERSLLLPPRSALTAAIGLNGGTIWIMRAAHAYQTLDVWLQHAAKRAFETRDPAIARLMSWSLPERTETRAALWDSAADPDAEADWFMKLEHDRGHSLSHKQAVDRLRDTRRQIVETPASKVFGFTGRAKCGDKEIADVVAKERNVPHISFGEWLKKQAQDLGQQQARPILQALGQQMLEAYGALPFCLSVLEDLAPPPGPPAQLTHQIVSGSFVLESVRHRAVLDAMRFLVGAERFKLFSAERPYAERRQLLQGEHLVDVEAVMSHPTETEIDAVQQQAILHLHSDRGIESEAGRVLQCVAG